MVIPPSLIALFILGVVAVLNTIAWLAKRRQLHAKYTQRSILVREITELKKEAAQYNTPATFARSAKCQRRVNAKEKELALVESDRGSDKAHWLARVQQAARIIKISGAVVCTLYCFGKPMAYIPPELLLPVQRRLLALPHGAEFSQYGIVSIVPWMLACDRAVGMLVQAVLPPLAVSLPPPTPCASRSESEVQAAR